MQNVSIDSNGTFWLATYKGAFKFTGAKWTQYTVSDGLINDVVNNIVIDSTGIKWFLTEDGIAYYNDTIWDNILLNTYHFSFIQVLVDKYDRKWLKTNFDHWYVFDPRTSALSKESINYEHFDYNNDSVVIINNEAFSFDGETWSEFEKPEEFKDNYISSILTDKNGRIWFCYSGGIATYNKGMWTSYLQTQSSFMGYFSDLEIDEDGIIWVATGSGVSTYNDTIWNYYRTADRVSSIIMPNGSVF